METLPGCHFQTKNLSPTHSLSTTSTTHTVSPQDDSLPSMTDETHSFRRVDGDLDSSDDASRSLEELMSLSNDPFHALANSFSDLTKVDQSSTACVGSPNSSRETLETSMTMAISPHELARRFLKAQQREALKTQAQKTRGSRDASLETYLQMTRPQRATSFDESNATLFNELKRSKSEKSLLDVEKESVSGRKLLRRRSNSFSELTTPEKKVDKVFDDVTLMRLGIPDKKSPKVLPCKKNISWGLP